MSDYANLINRLRCTHSIGSWATSDDQRAEAADAIEKLIQQWDELRSALMSLLIAKDEKEFHGDTPVYQSLKRAAWKEARAAISNATQSTTTKETQ